MERVRGALKENQVWRLRTSTTVVAVVMMMSTTSSSAAVIIVLLDVGAAPAPSAAFNTNGGIDRALGDSLRHAGGNAFGVIGAVDHAAAEKKRAGEDGGERCAGEERRQGLRQIHYEAGK